MTPEDLATGGDQPETTSAPAAAPETEKADTAPAGDQAETTAEEGKQPEAAKTTADPAKEAEAASEAAKALQKRKQTMQERLNEVSFERRKAENRANDLAAELAKLKGRMKAPVVDEYTDPAKLTADQVNHTLDQREVQRLEAEQTRATQDADKARAIAWHERSEIFKAENPTIDLDKIASEARFSEATSMMIADMEEGPAVLVQLQGNPAEARRIEGLPERQRAFALGKIAAQVTSPPPKRITTAPTPINAVGGKSTGANDDPAEMSMAEYARRRQAGWRG